MSIMIAGEMVRLSRKQTIREVVRIIDDEIKQWGREPWAREPKKALRMARDRIRQLENQQ